MEQEKSNKGSQWLQLMIVIIVLAVAAFFVIRFIYSFLWWIIAALAVGVLIVNRKIVGKVLGFFRDLYKKNTILGVAGTLGAIIGFTPFMAFLLLKTVWDFRKSDIIQKKGTEANIAEAKTPINITPTAEIEPEMPTYIKETKQQPPTNQ